MMVNTPPSTATTTTVAPPATIIFSPYEKTLDMNDKDSVKLFEKGSEKLPYFRLFINDVASRAT